MIVLILFVVKTKRGANKAPFYFMVMSVTTGIYEISLRF